MAGVQRGGAPFPAQRLVGRGVRLSGGPRGGHRRPERLVRRWEERTSHRLVLIGIAILPMLLVRGWGTQFTEPKLACLLALSVVGLTSLAARVWSGGRLTVTPLSAGFGALLVLQIASTADWANFGVHLQALALTVSARRSR